MSPPQERIVDVAGCRCRIWEKGDGSTVGFLAGFRGTPRWTPFLDHLARSHRVVVPALPGFPGAEAGHRQLDDTIDWITMTLDLLEASGLAGADLVAESVGAMLALEAAALHPPIARRLVAIGALGWCDPAEPVRNPFQTHAPEIPALLCSDPKAYANAFAPRSFVAAEIAEHEILLYRADEAAARLIWPFADRGLRKRLHRVQAPVLLLWGDRDAIVPASYAPRFAAAIAAPARVEIVAGAGHLATIDAPERVAAAITRFLQAPIESRTRH
jgi:pimeloyl-ACP methyl ester carboxylesterase